MSERFLNDRVELHCGDCRDVLATLPENSLDACVTDPPYGIQFMGRGWDHGVPGVAFWLHVFRVLKPGAHLVAFGGTRTFHRLACAIEDAGFEIRDTVSWLYGSGFPKSHDVSKGIDRAAGAERTEVLGPSARHNSYGNGSGNTVGFQVGVPDITAPATDAAREWQGWGTALKPACELIVLARKPLSEPIVAANVLRWGTGAINVDGCRIPGETPSVAQLGPTGGDANERFWNGKKTTITSCFADSGSAARFFYTAKADAPGRWPANVVHDGSPEVVAAFPETTSGSGNKNTGNRDNGCTIGNGFGAGNGDGIGGDSGSAARFFYTSKADADDRLGSKHPTVKPLDLMQWLVRLVCRKGGTVLDPFAGTGTTGEAAWREGMRAVLIEAEPEYQADTRRRMALALAGPDERQRESIKAKNLPRDDGPLFAGRETWADMWAKPFDFSQEPEA